MKKIRLNSNSIEAHYHEKIGPKSIWTNLLILSMFLAVSSCGKGVPPEPPLAIYKTSLDYFDNYNSQIKKNGEIPGLRQYCIGDNRIAVYEKDTILATRIRLDGGYVLSAEVGNTDVFTSLKIKDIVRNYSNGANLTVELIKKSIIDEDPFINFYSIDGEDAFKYLGEFSNYPSPQSRYLALQKRALELNEDIKNGNLAKLYHRIK